MALTLSEALAAADRIWGRHRVVSVRIRPDGGFDVNLLQARGLAASDTRGRNYSAHRLDAAGVPDCHEDCRSIVAVR